MYKDVYVSLYMCIYVYIRLSRIVIDWLESLCDDNYQNNKILMEHIGIYVCICVCIWIFIFWVCRCMYIHINIYMYTCIYMCMYIYVQTYIYINCLYICILIQQLIYRYCPLSNYVLPMVRWWRASGIQRYW
jgi:hypothetical protein